MTQPVNTPTPAALATAAPARSLIARLRNTPDQLRAIAILTVAVALLAGVIAWVLADGLVDDTNAIADSTGEVLVVNQQVNASFAEAHAAAVSVHLAGADGDPEQRRLYELAIERAAAGLEQVARFAGDDGDSHEALERVAARTTRYVSLIETARAGAVAGDRSADAVLAQATDITRNDIAPELRFVTERFQAQLDSQTGSGWFLLAFVGFVVLLAVLVVGQIWLKRRFRRVLNPPLVIATVIAVAWLVVTGWTYGQQRQALDFADDQAYRSIQISEQIQQTAYEYRASETSFVLAGSDDATVLNALADDLQRPGGLLDLARSAADNNRELVGIDEVAVRWDRYRAASQQVSQALTAGDLERAETITRGLASSAFNGFNTSVEAALLNNREQFFDEISFAADSVRWLRWSVIVAAALIALLAWSGYSIRLREYQ